RATHKCVTMDEIHKVTQLAAQTAFKPSSIPLGPLFWATADRTFMQAAMVYWHYADVDDDSKLNLFFPFYFDYCSPEAKLFATPLGGHREDASGKAGL